ncbi:MAG: hypothetical protein U9Q33_13170 [Campylobacterota bacterium]|nr:hypothetical protein [Campylobacterota bacterium]
MKRTDILFWILLAGVALFYLLKGNDMYQDKWDHRKSVFTGENNVSLGETKK